ncbi:MAG TPA: protein kinase [Anaerolineales bacterium]|nr:protein kinase [Anaerolineales bacterium]
MPPIKFGRYEIVEELRRGGMATVYRAYDPHFERDVALKVLPRQLLHEATFEERFKREAKVIAALEHPTIVPVHDFGEEDGQPYLVMRLMNGGSLADRLRSGSLTLDEIVDILQRVGQALDQAHAKGIVHRDLKPGNILFDEQGNAYLSDFGIAKLLQTSTPLTESSAIIGTPAYMSPEQGRGERDIDGRSDVYSLGAILFEMLSGRLPYESETPTGQIIKHITDPIPNVLEVRPDLPPAIQPVIERAMAKRRELRYDKASEIPAALQAILTAAARPVETPAIVPVQAQPAPVRVQPVQVSPAPASQPGKPVSMAGRPTQPTPLPLPARRRLPKWLFFVVGGGMALIFLVIAVVIIGLALPGLFPASTAVEQALGTPLVQPGYTLAPLASETPLPTLAATAAPALSSTPFAYTGSSPVAVRSSPSSEALILEWFPKEGKMTVLGRSEDSLWLQIARAGRNQVGWVLASAVSFEFDISQLPVK